MSAAEGSGLHNGAPIDAADIADALTRAPFTYADGATQVFTPDGRTTYTEIGGPTYGQWGVEPSGEFWSFWPPSYRATYDVYWIVEAGEAVGVRFTVRDRGTTSDGRYASA